MQNSHEQLKISNNKTVSDIEAWKNKIKFFETTAESKTDEEKTKLDARIQKIKKICQEVGNSHERIKSTI